MICVRWLTVSGESSHYGCLTDGKEWRFYVVDGESMFINFVLADNRENTVRILGRYPDLQPFNSRRSHLLVRGAGARPG